MSLILDAINRADQERSESNHSPSLQTSQSPEAKPQPPYLRWAIEGLLALIIIGFVINEWVLNTADNPDNMSQSTTTMPGANPSAAAPAPVSTPVRTVTETSQAVPAAKAETSAPETFVATVKATAPVTQPAAKQVNNTNKTGSAQPASSISQLYAKPVASSSPHSAPQPVTPKPVAAQPVIPPAPEPEPTAPIVSGVPLLTELPWRVQQNIPSIDFTQHNYSRYPGESNVELNRQLLKAGEQVAPGLRLLSIDPEFITLNFQGTKFRLWALNSWVNFN